MVLAFLSFFVLVPIRERPDGTGFSFFFIFLSSALLVLAYLFACLFLFCFVSDNRVSCWYWLFFWLL